MKRRLATDAADPGAPVNDGSGTVDYRHSLRELDRILPEDRILVTDGGRFMVEAWKTIKVSEPTSFVMTINFASIGLGLSHATLLADPISDETQSPKRFLQGGSLETSKSGCDSRQRCFLHWLRPRWTCSSTT